MSVLSELKPREVFRFFEEICGIPHGSGNVDRISDYLVSFAKERGLFYIQDELKNVIIVKEASAGYEEEPALIIQGHMDMVAVKKPELDMDMRTEGLRLAVDGDLIYAQGTSLGGDDGIAVAYILALLDDGKLAHPRLEAVITVDEEVGMDGARGIDLSMLTGHRMLNLDSEEEGIFLASCAGGARVHTYVPYTTVSKEGVSYRVTVGGLLGGHSGGEIHKERGNSNCLMGRLLYALTAELPVCLVSMEGGLADNAIPRQTEAVLVTDQQNEERMCEMIRTAEREIRTELAVKDPGFVITVEREAEGKYDCADAESTAQLASYLLALPGGVQGMSADIPGLVETSLNLGIMQLQGEEQELSCDFSVRSCIESAKRTVIGKVCAVTELAGGSYSVSGDYPGWAYRADSPLREKMIRVYERMYGKKPEVQAIHAGLECGILASKIEDLDCISMGPDMRDIHTTEETLSISSTGRVWEYIVALLAEKDGAAV
ncbi:MAG: aminoacyl-histidine dipeptidase [Lachnospiraceae bacterium]|nr:aminoacyl-histidine dipeptidase [Lachnospiraceae bacterium]